ncbi:MAG: universal stress protein [Bdellovibrionota bacterium]
MHFSRILVTTDFSEASYRAFDLAAYERKMEGAEIRLLYVYQYFHAPVTTPDIPVPLLGSEFYETNRQRAQAKLEDVGKRYFHGQNVVADAVLSLQVPGDVICRYAEEQGVDVIVSASRGHTPLKALFLGSTVQRVLLKAKCPVLIVPVGEDA